MSVPSPNGAPSPFGAPDLQARPAARKVVGFPESSPSSVLLCGSKERFDAASGLPASEGAAKLPSPCAAGAAACPPERGRSLSTMSRQSSLGVALQRQHEEEERFRAMQQQLPRQLAIDTGRRTRRGGGGERVQRAATMAEMELENLWSTALTPESAAQLLRDAHAGTLPAPQGVAPMTPTGTLPSGGGGGPLRCELQRKGSKHIDIPTAHWGLRACHTAPIEELSDEIVAAAIAAAAGVAPSAAASSQASSHGSARSGGSPQQASPPRRHPPASRELMEAHGATAMAETQARVLQQALLAEQQRVRNLEGQVHQLLLERRRALLQHSQP